MEKQVKLSAANVVLKCDDPGSWQISCTRGGDKDIEYIFLTMENEKEALLPEITLNFRFPMRDITCRWQADGFFDKNLPPDWNSRFESELAVGAPVLGYCGQNGENRLICAVSDALRKIVWTGGVCEYDFNINSELKLFTSPEAPATSYSTVLRFDSRKISFCDALADNFKWFEGFYPPVPVPEAGLEAWYSTWYSYHKELKDSEIEAECAAARKLGMGGVIVDDGWQTDKHDGIYDYTGDWQVAPGRIAEMKKHVDAVHKCGLKYMLWYSVPFIGYKSVNFERFKGKYLYHDERQGAAVLDPRFPEVREFLASLYERAQKEWGIDGFKLDFIDSFSVKDCDPAAAEGYAGRDILTLPDAVDALLGEIVARLRANDPDVLIEFRQNYIGPAVTKYGNMLRAADCPGDRQANRVRIADLRLTSGKAAVHADMLEWNVATSAEEAAGSVISAIFGTVQYSMMLSDLPEDHLKMIAHWVRFAEEHCEALQKGAFSGFSPEAGYPILCGESEKKRIIGLYGNDRVVRIGDMEKITFVLNGSGVPSVCVELPEKARFEVRDTFGATVCSGEAGAGISRMSVPLGGYAIFRSGR